MSASLVSAVSSLHPYVRLAPRTVVLLVLLYVACKAVGSRGWRSEVHDSHSRLGIYSSGSIGCPARLSGPRTVRGKSVHVQ